MDSGRGNVAERQPAAARDSRKIPEDIADLLGNGIRVAEIGRVIALLFLGLAEQAAGLTEQAEEWEAECLALPLVGPRRLARIAVNGQCREIASHEPLFLRSVIASGGTCTP